MNPTPKKFFEKYEFLIPLLLFVLFLAFTLPGIPNVFNPDEIVARSIKALHGEWQFSEINFNYPDLPQYVMFWLGKIVLALGYSDTEILFASRTLSAILAGLSIVLVYIMVRRAGENVYVAGLSGLLLLCVSDLSNNGRFAHNDTYAVFFSVLSILCLLEYSRSDSRLWLYASFITVGMAASSKYIAGSLVFAPLAVFLILQRDNLRKQAFPVGETLFISSILTFLGFAVGTPKSLTWMSFYFKRVYAALDWQVSWGRRADSVRGIFGQFGLMNNTLGTALFLLLMVGMVWSIIQVIRAARTGTLQRTSMAGFLGILLIGILAIDLPVMISYNYQPRYLLPFMPLLAILAAYFIKNIYLMINPHGKMVISIIVGLIVVYSFMRLTSMMLLFIHDARIPAGQYITTNLPPGTSLEHTSYPPPYPDGYFAREHNYPLYIQMGTIDTVPASDKGMKYNAGEAGLESRKTDYFVVDSFTADKFNDPYVCKQVAIECAFFKQLKTGRSAHYQLLKEFKYSLPWYLPSVPVTFANPTIWIYERIP